MNCRRCGRILFPVYGDGDTLCAECMEYVLGDNLPLAIEPKPGEPWQPVLGWVGGVGFGEGRKG